MSVRIWLFACLLIVMGACSSSHHWAPSGVYHTVEKGQTLYAISRIYGVDMRHLARINGLEDPTRLRVGQRLLIPGAVREMEVPASVRSGQISPRAAAPAPAPVKKAGPPDRSSNQGRVSKMKVAAAGKTRKSGTSDRPDAAQGRFIWPVRGQVMQPFGRQGNRFCQGLEIAAPAGTPVLSAADGRVTYSGNGIRGFGELIIVRHDGDFFTVYGFNQKSLVETGTLVRQGQKIALSGIPPGGGSPRIHFEIRQGKSPVDPIFYLP